MEDRPPDKNRRLQSLEDSASGSKGKGKGKGTSNQKRPLDHLQDSSSPGGSEDTSNNKHPLPLTEDSAEGSEDRPDKKPRLEISAGGSEVASISDQSIDIQLVSNQTISNQSISKQPISIPSIGNQVNFGPGGTISVGRDWTQNVTQTVVQGTSGGISRESRHEEDSRFSQAHIGQARDIHADTTTTNYHVATGATFNQNRKKLSVSLCMTVYAGI
jgi:hypothetical protein